MNANTQIQTSDPAPGSRSSLLNRKSEIVNPRRRRTGKVATLPKSFRDQINLLLQDGVPYRRIIEQLHAPGAPPLPYPLSENNLSEWKNGGYQDWLQDQFWQQEIRARHETFAGLLAGADPLQLPEGALQFAALGLCELLRDLHRSAQADPADPMPSVRIAHALARLSRAILLIHQHRQAAAARQAAQSPDRDPDRDLTMREHRAVVRHVDRILGIDPINHPVKAGEAGLVYIKLDPEPTPAPAVSAPPGPPAPQTPTADSPATNTPPTDTPSTDNAAPAILAADNPPADPLVADTPACGPPVSEPNALPPIPGSPTTCPKSAAGWASSDFGFHLPMPSPAENLKTR